MYRNFWLLLGGFLLIAGAAHALEMSSLAPTRGTPGTLVTISGGPFTERTEILLGGYAVAPLRVLENQLDFTVPYLPTGDYLVSVRDNGQVATETYRFEVMAPTPEITDLDPRNIDVCASEQGAMLQVTGQNFQPGASLLINDIVVPSSVIGETSIEAQLRGVRQAGVYGVSVRNPDGASSLPHSLWIDNIPEISSVEQGGDFVNYYEVIIHGKNFHPNSTLVVKEPEASMVGSAYRQFSFMPRGGEGADGGANAVPPQRNRLIYVDCQTLVYHRYPSNFQEKSLGLQILNPDGSRTGMLFVDLP